MIEEIIIRYLSKNGFQCFMEVPRNIEGDYIIVEKTNSSNSNFINHATLAIQSYSTSLYKASCLNEKVKEAIENMIELDEISKVKLNTDYNFTDTTKKQYRYQAVYEITYY